MPTSDESVLSFLTDNDVTERERAKVAIAFAESMVLELREVLQEWEDTAERLRKLSFEIRRR